jgi:hypothetical protein
MVPAVKSKQTTSLQKSPESRKPSPGNNLCAFEHAQREVTQMEAAVKKIREEYPDEVRFPEKQPEEMKAELATMPPTAELTTLM